ncbi:MAG: hypothetical protein ACTS6J_09965 [Burkholderiales bacterium]
MSAAVDQKPTNSGTVSAPLSWTKAHSVWLLLFLVALTACGLWASSYGSARVTWLVSLIFMGLTVVLIGQGTPRVWRDILIDDRYVMRLSRFQIGNEMAHHAICRTRLETGGFHHAEG